MCLRHGSARVLIAAGGCAEFCFKGDFRRVDRSTTSTVLCETMSDAIGSATLRGAALDGPVHAFNLAGEVDCFVKRMAFATSGGAVYALDVTTGAVALLEKADLQAKRVAFAFCFAHP